MSNGLSKLVDAAAQVDELRKVLEINQQEIAEKNVQVEAVRIFLLTIEILCFSELLYTYYFCHTLFIDPSDGEREKERSRGCEGTSASV